MPAFVYSGPTVGAARTSQISCATHHDENERSANSMTKSAFVPCWSQAHQHCHCKQLRHFDFYPEELYTRKCPCTTVKESSHPMTCTRLHLQAKRLKLFWKHGACSRNYTHHLIGDHLQQQASWRLRACIWQQRNPGARYACSDATITSFLGLFQPGACRLQNLLQNTAVQQRCTGQLCTQKPPHSCCTLMGLLPRCTRTDFEGLLILCQR